MSYKHLTISERSKIEVLHQQGYSARGIARILGVHHATVARELKRCPGMYQATQAQEDKDRRSRRKGRKLKSSDDVKALILEKLNLKWSPEQIVGRALKGKLSFKTIYNWLYAGILNFDLRRLRHKGRSRVPVETRGRFNVGRSIRNRPKEIKSRTSFGHWELDTVVSGRGKSKSCLATFVERTSRFYIALPMKDRSKESMLAAAMKLIRNLPKEALKSFTSDRGKEFACYKEIEAQGIDFYFADPYAAWQRGSNENSNGLLREYYPKGSNLSKATDEALIADLLELNNRPRKCLGYRTPFEVFLHELHALRVSQ